MFECVCETDRSVIVRIWTGNYSTALEHFNLSLELNKDYEKARSWQQKVRTPTLLTHSLDVRFVAPVRREGVKPPCLCLPPPCQVLNELNPAPAEGVDKNQQHFSQSPSNGVVLLDPPHPHPQPVASVAGDEAP